MKFFPFGPTLILLIAQSGRAFAFSVCSPQGWFNSHISVARKSNSCLPATIYSTSWDEDGESTLVSSFDDSELCGIDDDELVDLICQEDRIATLARIAAAYSPGSSLKLADIHKIEVVAVDGDHIDISAVVCDQTSCVTVFVPVNFEHTCNGSDTMEECIMDNIEDLDQHALEMLQEKEAKDRYMSAINETILKAFYDDDAVEFPSWWISEVETNDKNFDPDLAQDIHAMKALLNDMNFQEEIQLFSTNLLHSEFNAYESKALMARVVTVGLNGFCVRAIVSEDETAEVLKVIDLSYRFETEATDGASLRSSLISVFR